MTSEEARKLLRIFDPLEVAWTSKDGTLRADDGMPIDKRQTVPWVWALGPFGSWVETLEAAEVKFRENPEWEYGRSLRHGFGVWWKDGWGFGAVSSAEASGG